MKQSCNVIKDLLVLYEDDACSEDSKMVVEEHLQECPDCNSYYKKMQCTDNLIIEEMKEELAPKDKVITKSLKKIRRRWIASIVAVFMLLPLLGVGIMAFHEAHDDGVAFSNLDDIYRCVQYLKYIEDKEFEKAASMVDFSQNEYTLVECVQDMTLEEYQAYMTAHFIEKMQEYDALGIYIDNICYNAAYRAKDEGWRICVSFDENYPDGSEQKIVAHLDGETMYAGAYEYPHVSSINMDDYIDEILHLYSEDDPLNYERFEVSFELKEGEKAIISWSDELEKELDLLSAGVFNISYGTGTPLVNRYYGQNTFMTSVPGQYAVCGTTSEGETVYLTEADIEIQIVEYEE